MTKRISAKLNEENPEVDLKSIRSSEINSKTIKTQDIENLFQSRIGVLILDIESIELQVSILKELTNNRNIKPFLICVETLDISEGSNSCKEIFDNILFRFK